MATMKKRHVVRMLFCDFCGASQESCELLIQGRDETHICEACVNRCVDMVIEFRRSREPEVVEPLSSDAVDPHVSK